MFTYYMVVSTPTEVPDTILAKDDPHVDKGLRMDGHAEIRYVSCLD